MEPCKKCGGSGVLGDKGNNLPECSCAVLKRVSMSMPVYIRRATILRDHFKFDCMKHPEKSYFIVSSWADAKALLKLTMMYFPNKFYRFTSDREIKDVFVGATSAKSRQDEMSTAAIYNSVQDLMEGPDLVVIRLNELVYKNKAASGALEEALCYRLDRDLPIWVLNNRDRLFTSASSAYSDSVRDLLKTFETVNIPRIADITTDVESFASSPSSITSSIFNIDSPKPSENQKKPRSTPPARIAVPDKLITEEVNSEPIVSSGLSMYGKGLSSSKSKFRRNNGDD